MDQLTSRLLFRPVDLASKSRLVDLDGEMEQGTFYWFRLVDLPNLDQLTQLVNPDQLTP